MVEQAVLDGDVLAFCRKTAPLRQMPQSDPVTFSLELSGAVEQRPVGLGEHDIVERDVLHAVGRRSAGSDDPDQLGNGSRSTVAVLMLDSGGGETQVARETSCRTLPRGIQEFDDVSPPSRCCSFRCRGCCRRPIGWWSCREVVVVPPQLLVWMPRRYPGPSAGFAQAEAFDCASLAEPFSDLGVEVVVRVACQDLEIPVQEELIDVQVGGDLGRLNGDAVSRWSMSMWRSPWMAAADDRVAISVVR